MSSIISKINSVSEEELRELVKNSITYAEVLRSLGYHEKGGGPWKNLKKRLIELNIDTSHFKGRAHGTSNTKKYTMEEILVENSPYSNINRLKIRLLKEGYKENKCENPECGLTEWLGKPISLQLHHINGVNNDHRLENLQLLCPNCHSQTENFAGRNIYN